MGTFFWAFFFDFQKRAEEASLTPPGYLPVCIAEYASISLKILEETVLAMPGF